MLYGTDGKTMSKTSDNTINLLDSPKNKFGKAMSIIDEMIIHYFEFTTDLPIQLIKEREKALKSGKIHPMALKKKLAFEIVKMYHGEKQAQEAQKEFERVFQKKKLPAKIAVFKTKKKEWKIVDLLMKTKLVSSRSEAKRLIRQGAIKINESSVSLSTEAKIKIKSGDVIRVGKRRFMKIKLI
jgi:tyrosyl-tRNA synthetase